MRRLFWTILAALAITTSLLPAMTESEVAHPAPPSKYDAHIVELDRAALDAAYQNQVMHLFEQWMKDDHGQPTRATRGVAHARAAYIDAMTVLDAKVLAPKQ